MNKKKHHLPTFECRQWYSSLYTRVIMYNFEYTIRESQVRFKRINPCICFYTYSLRIQKRIGVASINLRMDGIRWREISSRCESPVRPRIRAFYCPFLHCFPRLSFLPSLSLPFYTISFINYGCEIYEVFSFNS